MEKMEGEESSRTSSRAQIDMQRNVSLSTSFLHELKGNIKWLLRVQFTFRYLKSNAYRFLCVHIP